jgi:hypothetical protein
MRSVSTSRAQLGPNVAAVGSSREETEMNRLWTGVVAGVLAAALLLTVGFGAFQAGRDDEVVTRVVTDGSEGGGQVVRVVDDGWRHGPGPGFFLFPLLIILLVFVFARRGRWHGYGHGWRHGYGPYGGPGGYQDPREAWLSEWHRRAHEGEVEEGSPPPTTPSDASAG